MNLLTKAIVAYDARYRFLRNPEDAHGRCCYESTRFAQIVPGARMLHLLGMRRHHPRGMHNVIDEHPYRDPYYYHAIVVVGQTTIDWTRRALDPRCRHPFIQSLAQTRREWHRSGITERAVGL